MLKFGQLAVMALFWCFQTSAAEPVWFYQNMNHSNVVEYRSVKDAENVVTHHWYVHPENEDDAGNYLVIIYKEDSRLAPLPGLIDELKKTDLKNVGGYYFTCAQVPERYFFSNGFYFTRFVITNYETQPESCLLRALLPRNSEKTHTVHPMKNPSIGIAASKLIGAPKHVSSEPPMQTKRVARQITKIKIEHSASFKPPKNATLGSYQRISEMPAEVLEK